MDRIISFFRGNPEPLQIEMFDMSDEARDKRMNDSIVNVAEQMVPSKVKNISTRTYPHLPKVRYHVCTITLGEVNQRYTEKAEKDKLYFKITAIYPNYDHTHDGWRTYDEIIMSVKLHKPIQVEDEIFENEPPVDTPRKNLNPTEKFDPYEAELIDKVMIQAQAHLLAHKHRHDLMFHKSRARK